MCDNGRYETPQSVGPTSPSGTALFKRAWTVQVMLSCVIMTALGGPVVPDV